KATDRVFEGENIVNKVSTEQNDGKGEQWIDQQILFKSHGNANYADKTVDWTISFNHDAQKMNNVVLTDVFTNAGLTLLPDTLVITNDKGTLKKGVDYNLVQ
ncbi:hypothetical protein J4G37_59405, partial [Microvirga sp. 3-52]|nr:hypothetical protein [Microvirga sp. 3-52]